MPITKKRKDGPVSGFDTVEEEDCGFKFRRVSTTATSGKKVVVPRDVEVPTKEGGQEPIERMAAKSVPAAVAVASAVGEETKKRRRRRSSFAAIASRAAPRPSSFSVSLSTKLPPSSVHSRDYHKHLLPDLPGPIKMRQLLIWAVQKVALTDTEGRVPVEMTEALVQALFNNQINTSWYQRPSSLPLETDKLAAPVTTVTRTGSKNQELLDCIEIYERYQAKLRTELAEWKLVSQKPSLRPPEAVVPAEPVILTYPHRIELEALSSWMTNLPRSIDQLHWTLSVASTFEKHAHAYCESVFHQIRANFFSSTGTADGSASSNMPMLLMKALGNQ